MNLNDYWSICHPELVEGSPLLAQSCAIQQGKRSFDYAQDDRYSAFVRLVRVVRVSILLITIQK